MSVIEGQTIWFYYIDADGDANLLNDHTNVFLIEEDGFGLEDGNPISERIAYSHGVRATGYYLPERELLLTFGIKAEDDITWRARDDAILRALSPFRDERNVGAIRRVRADGTIRQIGCWLVGYSRASKDRDGPVYGERLLKFWCPDPFFYDPTPTQYNFSVKGTTGFTFPFEFPFTFAESNINAHQTVYNEGDAEAWPHIYIYGPLTTPTIENETWGLWTTVSLTLAAGDYLDINMEDSTVNFYDASQQTTEEVTHHLSSDSFFWSLKRGTNIIHIFATDAINGGVIFSYFTRYMYG